MLQAYYGIEDEKLWQLATGLGAGLSRQRYVCGAVTGATLALGLANAVRRGSNREDVRGLRDETYAKVQELTRRFEVKFGSSSCGELTGCDFRTREGQSDFKAKGLMDSLCRPAVRFAVESVIDLESRDHGNLTPA